MTSFVDIPTGKTPAAAIDIQQVIDALKGTAGKGIPLSVTAVNDAIAYAVSVKNTDATNSRAVALYGADGNPLLTIDKNGVQASAYGANALAPVVTTTQQQNLTGKTYAATLTGAAAAARFVGGTSSGAPSAGTFAVGDYVIDQTGKVWTCTVAGTPGTWASLPNLPTYSANPAGDTALTAGTTTDICSLVLPAGTYLLLATAALYSATVNTVMGIRVYNSTGAASLSTVSTVTVVSNQRMCVSAVALTTLGAVTVKLQALSITNAGTCALNDQAFATPATVLTALRIA